ncbi:unnamed protein product (macronuclear) [Paramecium tetraurelia]|uniref:TNFR-Cys domain-containing protein n=1 Tax=Paramecium tetraurelia TaxID=5888 RepID=A0CDJ4_PARTE|nr:uncharacterized protein GSPATT00007072001 [Paramecium tetraurelia]CAK68861.1 unnamed protein product [Paramecium tetraurelia]|eukprot:XP_001436258.1 hypothetical protein (macronuclear) [Paramecium tetraurelia strain d4-2]
MLRFISLFLQISLYLFIIDFSFIQQTISDLEVIDEEQSFYKTTNKIQLDENNSYGYEFWFKFNLIPQHSYQEVFEEELITVRYNNQEYSNTFLIFSEWDSHSKQITVLYFLQQTYSGYCTLYVILYVQDQKYNLFSQFIGYQNFEGSWVYTHFGFQRNTNIFQWLYYSSEDRLIQGQVWPIDGVFQDLAETTNIVGGSGKIQFSNQELNLQKIRGRFTPVIFTKGILYKEALPWYLAYIHLPDICTGALFEIVYGIQYLDGTNYLERVMFLKGKKFIIKGWNKLIIKKNQYQDSHLQLMRITTNKVYTENSNIGDKLFQLIYILNTDLNKQSGIQVNAQRITIPFLSFYYDSYFSSFFYNDDLMLKRLSNWVFFSFEQGGQKQQLFKIFFTYDSFSLSFDFGNFYYPYTVYQLADVPLYILIGGDKFSSRFYYQGYVQNLYIQTCLSEQDLYQYYNPQQDYCHPMCKTCNGPNQNNCLTCHDYQNRQYYIGKNICLCKFGFSEVSYSYSCKDIFSQYKKEILGEQQSQECQINLEMNGLQICSSCPEINYRCYDCILNPNDWISNPLCTKDIVYSSLSSSSMLINKRESKDYTLYTLDLEFGFSLCEGCERLCVEDEVGCNHIQGRTHLNEKVMVKCKNEGFYFEDNSCQRCKPQCLICVSLNRCQTCLDGYYQKDGDCFQCQKECTKCLYNDQQKIQCTTCVENYGLIQGSCQKCGSHCISCEQSINRINQNVFLRCLICEDNKKFMISYDQFNCIDNQINHCNYGFIYSSIDRVQNTLMLDQDFITLDTAVFGCAQCEEYYEYDIQNQLCQYNYVEKCKQIILDQGQQICLVFTNYIIIFPYYPSRVYVNDFECDRQLDQCIQCLNLSNIYYCLFCKTGYYADQEGLCVECPKSINCKNCYIQSKKYKDNWKKNIRATFEYFYMNYYVDQSLFTRLNSKPDDEYEILCYDCWEDYEFYNGQCIKACDCVSCVKIDYQNICEVSPYSQDYTSLTVIEGKIIDCSTYCLFCFPLLQEEIRQINPYFQNSVYSYYSNKCLIPNSNFNNLVYDSYLKQYKKCQTHSNCQMEITLNYFLICQNEQTDQKEDSPLLITIEQLFSISNGQRFKEFQNQVFYEYANAQMIENIIINIEVQDSKQCLLPQLSQLSNEFFTNIFSIRNIKLHLFSQNSVEFVVNELSISSFQQIQLENIQFKPYFQRAFRLYINSLIKQQIILKNLNFTNQKQVNSFQIQIMYINNLELHNVRFNEIETNYSYGLIQITQAKSNKLYFKDIKLLNSILFQSVFLYLNYVTLSEIIFEDLQIETEFQYSSLLQYFNSSENDIKMSYVSIQSNLINCQLWLHFMQQNKIELNHFIIQSSYFVQTKLLYLRENTQVSDIQAFQNQFQDQSIILYFINGYSEVSTNQLTIKNVLFQENLCYNNYCLIYAVQEVEASLNQILLEQIYIYFNSRLSQWSVENVEEYETLIYLSLKTIIIDDLELKGDFMSQLDKQIPINQIHINNIVSLQITSIKISNINQPSASYLYQSYKCSKLQQSSTSSKPILMIQSFQNLKLNFFDIYNVVNFNAPIIKILSQNSQVQQLDEKILIQNINFTSNLLLTTQYFNSKSILEISSQQKQNIQIENFISSYNILHEYIQDYSISSSNVLLIESPQSDITMINSYFTSNTVINSSNTQLQIFCNTLQIINSTFIKHNQMDQSMIDVIFNKQFLNDMDVKYFEQLQNYFPIISQTGVGEFHFRNLIIQNIEINSTQGYQGGTFSLYPKNQGVIQVSQSRFINIKSQFSLFDTKGGCFYISLPSFEIDIVIKQCTFSNIWTQNYGSIIFVESVIDHLISLNVVDVFIKNAFSLQGSVIYLKQNKVDLNSINQLVFQNVEIVQEEDNFVGYLAEYMTIPDDQQNQFLENRSLIYSTYSNVSLENFTVLNIFQEMILECNQCEKILIRNLFIYKAKETLALFSIISDQNQIYIYFSNIQFLNVKNQIELFTDLNCNLKKELVNLESGCYSQNQNEQVNLKNNILFYYDDAYLQVLGRCNFNNIQRQIQNQQSLIHISIQSTIQQQIKFVNCLFESIQVSNAIIRVAIQTIPPNFIKLKYIYIQNNQCGQNGCIILESNRNQLSRLLSEEIAKEFERFDSQIKIDQLYCYNNKASNGVCLNIQNLSVYILLSQFYNNTASEYGGSIYFNSNSPGQQLLFKFCQFYNNQAFIAGAIYSNNIINNKWIKEYNYLDKNGCKSFGSTIVYPPMKLGVTFDNYNTIYYPITLHEGQNIKIDQIQFNKKLEQNYFNLPSGCVLNSYQTVTEDNLYINNNITFRLIGFDSNDEIMKNLEDSSCSIYDRIVDLQKVDEIFQVSELVSTSVNIKSIKFNNNSKDYNLDTVVLNSKAINNITNTLQLIFFCPSIQTQKVNSEYPYNIISTHSQYYLEINIVTLGCQLGEIQNQLTGACQQCDASQGFYSVLLNQILCDVQDDTTTAEVKPASLKLLQGYWRPEYDNRYITQCSNKVENCKGGWDVGYNSCEEGYFGALCEQCDIYNIRGDGRYSNTESYQCGECQPDYQSALYAILLNLWNLFSIIFSVKSSQTSILNQVNKKNQIAVSTFLKIFINYFQLLFVVSTFQLPIPYQITILLGFMGNPVRVISYSLDCSLVDKIAIDIIYFRMIQQILYPFIYLFIMSTAYLIYALYTKNKINFSYFYIAISYLVLYYSPQILSSLINLMSYRVISNISWVQADVSFQYDTYKHFQWIYILCTPLLIFLLISISSLFFLLFKKRNNLKKIRSLLYLGYLYLEYNTGSYFWEFVKLMLKILIVVVLTFLQERIIIKGCICFLILALYKSCISRYKPYKLRNINNIDQWASFVCLVSILLGMLLRVAYEIQLDIFPQIIYFFLAFLNIAFTLYLLNLIFQSYMRQYSEQLDEVKEFIKRTFPQLDKIKLCKKLLQNSSIVRNKAKMDLKRIASSVIQKSQQFNKSKLLMSKQQQAASIESRVQLQTVDDQMKTSLQLLQKIDLRRAFFHRQSLQNIQNEET